MKTHIYAGLMFILAVLIPLIIIQTGRTTTHTMEMEKFFETAREDSMKALEDITGSFNCEIQLQTVLRRFVSKVEEYIINFDASKSNELIGALYRNELAGFIPPHDLMVTSYNHFLSRSTIVFQHSDSLGFVPEVAFTILDNIAGFHDRIIFRDALAILNQKMSHALNFPFRLINLKSETRNTLQKIQGVEASRILFWNLLASGTFRENSGSWLSLKGAIGIVLDVGNVGDVGDVGETLTARLAVKNWSRSDVGLAIVPLKNDKKAEFSSFFLDRAEPIRDITSRISAFHAGSQEWNTSNTIYFSAKIPGSSRLAVLAYPLPETICRSSDLPPFLLVIGLGVILSGIYLTVEKTVFLRGPRISVGLILFGGFLFSALLPVLSLNPIIKRFLTERERKFEFETQESLRSRLSKLNDGFRHRQAEIYNSISSLAKMPELASEVYRDEIGGKNASFAAVFIEKHLENRFKTSFSGIQTVMAFGPRDYARNSLFGLAQSLSAAYGDRFEKLFKIVARKRLDDIGKHTTFADIRELDNSSMESSNAVSRSGMEFEVWRQAVYSMMDSRLVLNLFLRGSIEEVRWTLDPLYLLSTVIHYLGKPRYILLWSWNLIDHERNYLKECLENSFDNASDTTVFAINQADTVKAVFPRNKKVPLELLRLADQCRVSGLSSSKVERGDATTTLYEGMPGHFISGFVLTGRRTTDVVQKRVRLLERQGNTVIIAAFIVIGILALFGVVFFQAPLRGIMRGARQIKAGNYAITFPEASRSDEFGTLAQTLTSLARGLREKEILSRFVSASAKRVVSDAEFGRAAIKGERRDMTFMFSGLVGFEEYQMHKSTDEIFDALEIHLTAVEEAVKREGGEINLVLGEKMLIVFDNKRLGGAFQAAVAAIKTAESIQEKLSNGPQCMAGIGIADGSVVAGILGGGEFKAEYTVIGDAVNLAARLFALSPAFGGTRIVFSGSIRRLLADTVSAERLPIKSVKGKTHEIGAFLFSGMNSTS